MSLYRFRWPITIGAGVVVFAILYAQADFTQGSGRALACAVIALSCLRFAVDDVHRLPAKWRRSMPTIAFAVSTLLGWLL